MVIQPLSRLWEEHPLVSHRSTLCPSGTNLRLSHSSAIIQDIQTSCKAGLGLIAYFYFDFRDLEKQNRRNLLSSLLVQLSAQSSTRCDILYRLYLEHEKGTQAHRRRIDPVSQGYAYNF